MTPLFAQPLDQWLAARKGQLLSAGGGRYPGNDASGSQLADAARDASYAFWVDPPRPAGEVVLEPFDAAELPEGVPGQPSVSRRMVRVTVPVEGDASLLACAPLRPAPRGGWPAGKVVGSAAVVELPEPVRAADVERVRAGVALACEWIARELPAIWQPAGVLLDEFRRRQGSNRERQLADQKARRRLEHLGYAVK